MMAIAGGGQPRRDCVPPLETSTISRQRVETGRYLAPAGCDLVVFSTDDDYVEEDVVHGFLGS